MRINQILYTIIDLMTDLSKYDNHWYNPGGTPIKRLLWYFCNAIFFKTHLNPISSIKVKLLRLFGATVGKGVVIKPGINIKYPWNLIVGDHTWLGEDVWIDNLAPVVIGANCCLSQGAMLLCGNHNYRLPSFDLIVKPITLEDEVWIGAKAVVCPGVTAHHASILTVGSVATHDLTASTIYQGTPASPKNIRESIQ